MLCKFTTSGELFQVLTKLMSVPELDDFRLVGGTALSLLVGHRMSVDIDLFTHKPYGSVDFGIIDSHLRKEFGNIRGLNDDFPALKNFKNPLGLNLLIMEGKGIIKTDILNWNDKFLFPPIEREGIRFATIEEIATMKLDVIARGGRKKDFWDLIEILEYYELSNLLTLYERKYPYNDIQKVINGLSDFSNAEDQPDPICLKSRRWEQVKADIKQHAADL